MQFLLILLLLMVGFALASLLTFLLSLTGIIAFTWVNALIVWGIIILLKLIF